MDRDIEQAADFPDGVNIEHTRNPSGERCPADWGSATDSQQCVFDADHDGSHRDAFGAWSPDSGNTRADKTDIARVAGKESNRPGATVAGRGDATQPDPAVKLAAIVEIAKAISAKVGQFDLDGPKHPSINDVAEAAYEAAAGVIVPATAEQIAWALERFAAGCNTQTDNGKAMRLAFDAAIRTARSFAAGLSAGATGGDGDE